MRTTKPLNIDAIALLARLGFGSFMLLGHGWFKLKLWWSGEGDTFPVSLGLGAEVELLLAIFAEVICVAAILVGFKTRLASIPPIVAMLVAAVIFHWNDSFFYLPDFGSNKEFALVYGMGFSLIFLLGSGQYSLDYRFKNK